MRHFLLLVALMVWAHLPQLLPAQASTELAWPRWPNCPTTLDASAAQGYTQQQLLLHLVPALAALGLPDSLLVDQTLCLHWSADSDSLSASWLDAPEPLRALLTTLPARGWVFPAQVSPPMLVVFLRDDADSPLQVMRAKENKQPLCSLREGPTPCFPGGNGALFRFLAENLRWPSELYGEIAGTIVVQFTVELDGKITAPKIVRSLNPLFDAEVLRVVGLMPPWWIDTSARGRVKAPVVWNLPIRVCLE